MNLLLLLLRLLTLTADVEHVVLDGDLQIPVGVDPRYLYADHEIVSLGEDVGGREPLGPARRDAART
jgi:hypothetical protein